MHNPEAEPLMLLEQPQAEILSMLAERRNFINGDPAMFDAELKAARSAAERSPDEEDSGPMNLREGFTRSD